QAQHTTSRTAIGGSAAASTYSHVRVKEEPREGDDDQNHVAVSSTITSGARTIALADCLLRGLAAAVEQNPIEDGFGEELFGLLSGNETIPQADKERLLEIALNLHTRHNERLEQLQSVV
ncbi:unnamed protein product, partial [Amoebophrya sp. A120]